MGTFGSIVAGCGQDKSLADVTGAVTKGKLSNLTQRVQLVVS